MNHHFVRAVATVCLLTVTSSIGYAQQAAAPAAGGESAELAKKLSNPISDLVSVPFQFNWEQNFLVSKLASFGPFPASYAIGVSAFVAHPDVGPSWKTRGQITLLLPKTRK